MTPTPAEPDAPVEELLGALDEAIALQQELLEHLETSAEAVGRLDARDLERRMADLAPMPARLAEAGRRRHRARLRVAGALGRPPREVTLADLERDLPAPLAGRIRRCRARLRDLADAVRRQHLRTSVLVGEAARINRSLLSAILPGETDARTYRTDGSPESREGRAMLDARR